MKKKTMKKTAILALGGLVIALALTASPEGFLARASRDLFSGQVFSSNKDEAFITKEEAVNHALTKIGSEATLEEIELDKDDKVPHYDIEMFDDNYEYDIDVHAKTGEVLDFKQEARTEDSKTDATMNGEYITKEVAIENALTKIGSEATLKKIELDEDDGQPYYDIEMFDGSFEYEVEVHAVTGAILDFDKDTLSKDSKNDPVSNTTFITKEQAIQHALTKIGSAATLHEIELDEDDGQPYYDIEMFDGSFEYEVEVHAVTGAILDFDKDALSKHSEKDPVVNITYITKEKAIQIALAKIGKQATLKEIQFDKDDNPPKYEIEMFDDMYEYEIEVHAISGVVLDFEKELD